MKFGLHYLAPCPESQTPAQIYQETLEQALRAEDLGFESVWPVEHHGDPRLSVLPSPAVLLAAIAGQTKHLRLGTAIIQLPLANPLRVAEDIATLDVISGGRVELGVGRGGIPTHYANYNIPMDEGRDRMVEALDYITRAFTQERFSFEGRFFKANNVSLVPQTLQRPHPPIRIAANGVDTLEFAGQRGYPLLLAAHVNHIPKLLTLLPKYHAARKAGGHREAVDDDISILIPTFVAETDSEVRTWAEPTAREYTSTMAANLNSIASSLDAAARANMDTTIQKIRATTYEDVRSLAAIFETPAGCRDRLAMLKETLKVGRVICWFNFLGKVPHAQAMRSMELFSAKVLPFA
jgi:alkanesulfonate monooxygenase SsuD/methylene tetrahydromethanopterin reductase-like flavin-dependent oxidoreductase (luciferase family)